MTFTQIEDIMLGYEDAGVFEDRLEYSLDDLMKSEHLDDKDAVTLYELLRNRAEIGPYDLSDLPAEIIKECLVEAQHGGWDGWSESAKATISYLMYDIVRYHRHSK